MPRPLKSLKKTTCRVCGEWETWTDDKKWVCKNCSEKLAVADLATLRERVAELEAALIVCHSKLIDYAKNDEMANGYGSGTFTNPLDFIKDEIAMIEKLLPVLKESKAE